ncbi:MAG: AAA family ATPase [Nitrospirae bacterium]|nr:AAA family ATPase [Nitrospirota bacterium]
MKNIVLTGFMGTGKTAVGRELARMLSMRLIDIDTEIEHSEGLKIADLFRDQGEERFREIESGMIRKAAGERHVIISTGGGAVLRPENIEALRRHSVIFCLYARPETIFRRTAENDERPLLQTDDPLKKIMDLLGYRRPFYEAAGIMIDTENKNPLQVAEEIAEIYNAEAKG